MASRSWMHTCIVSGVLFDCLKELSEVGRFNWTKKNADDLFVRLLSWKLFRIRQKLDLVVVEVISLAGITSPWIDMTSRSGLCRLHLVRVQAQQWLSETGQGALTGNTKLVEAIASKSHTKCSWCELSSTFKMTHQNAFDLVRTAFQHTFQQA